MDVKEFSSLTKEAQKVIYENLIKKRKDFNEKMQHRCSEDVKINKRLWQHLWGKLLRLYGSEEEAWRLIDYLMFKLDCAREQEKVKIKLDVDLCQKTLDEIEVKRQEKIVELKAAMPKVRVFSTKTRPAKPYKKSGAVSAAGEKWFTLLEERGLPKDYEGTVEVLSLEEDGNPNSHEQMKDWLFSLGWEPCTYAYKRNKETGEVRKIPQIQQDKQHGPGLAPSVKLLFEKEPKLQVLDGLSILNHRIGILKGFMRDVDEDGCIQAKMAGLTNTMRWKHAVVVNLPGIDKPYGKEIRGCLIAPEGYEFCGCDLESLEDNTKRHWIYPYDPEYVESMMTPGYDPHIALAKFAGEVSEKDANIFAEWKDEEEIPAQFNPIVKAVKKIRKMYKSVNYASLYSVGAETLSRTAGCSIPKASMLLDAYWKLNWSVKKFSEDQKIKKIGGQMWVFNSLSKLWYSLRAKKDVFSTINQGTGVFVFDTWVREIRKGGVRVACQYHDEVLFPVKKGYRDFTKRYMEKVMVEVNRKLSLNIKVRYSVAFGGNYAECH